MLLLAFLLSVHVNCDCFLEKCFKKYQTCVIDDKCVKMVDGCIKGANKTKTPINSTGNALPFAQLRKDARWQ